MADWRCVGSYSINDHIGSFQWQVEDRERMVTDDSLSQTWDRGACSLVILSALLLSAFDAGHYVYLMLSYFMQADKFPLNGKISLPGASDDLEQPL